MALYLYHAYTPEGKKITGTIDAPSVAAVREHLVKQKLYPTFIQEAKTSTTNAPWYRRLFRGSVSLKDKILFTKQLAVLLRSGVPLLQALELLTEQFPEPFSSMLIAIKDGIKEGKSLAEGLQQYPSVFPNIYVQLVRAGEASGNLELILNQLVEYLERREAIVKRVRSALNYPMMQMGVIVIAVFVLLKWVVPQIAQNFESQGAELPASTRLIMGLSSFVGSYWIFLIVGIVVFAILFRWWKSTPGGKRIIDTIKLKIPIIKYFTRMGAIVQFSRTLGMLIESGVNLAQALDIVVQITDNQILKDALSQARDQIIKQGKIAEFLKQTNVFPPIAIYLMKTGEESGQLGAMLLTVAKNYEDDLSEYADTLSSRLEPLMMVFMAIIVGFIVISIAQPMLQQTALMGSSL